MKLFRYLFIWLLLLCSGGAFAQTAVVSGKITEMLNGKKEPVFGVNVVVVNKQNRFLTGVVSDINGVYNLRVPTDEKELTIQFSFIGMKTQTVKYTGQPTIDVLMEIDAKVMDEVVVTGERIDRNDMGISSKEQTTATQKVRMDDIMATSPVVSVEEALQGQLGGVDIVLSGDPGAKSAIRIRGTSTLNTSSEPLIVIDGIPYSTDIDEDFDFSTANEDDFGTLLNIAPADIESIEVLKDASATAIWGTKGANGVLVIKTKRGTKGKTRFNFSTKFTTKFEPNTIPMLDGNQYVALMQDAIWNTANAKGLGSATELSLLFDTPEINYNRDWRYFDEYNQNTDWLEEIRKTALVTDNSFAMSGGGEKATYRFSLGYSYEPGTTIGTSYNRLTSALNINYQFSDRLRVDSDFSYIQSETEDSWTGSGTARSEAFRKMPNKSPYFIDDITGERTDQYFNYSGDFEGKFKSGSNFNPVAMVKESYNRTNLREAKITFRLNYDFMNGLTYQGWVSMNIRSNKNKKFLPQVATGVVMTDASANQSSDALSDNLSLQTENKLIYQKAFNENHRIVATGLFRTSQNRSSKYSSTTYGNASPGLADPTTGGTVSNPSSSESETRSVSAILSAHYTLLNRYILSGTVNMEGNSSIGNNNRWGYFPSLGLAWWLHEESFLRDKEWLELAKVRLGYGESGTSPSGSSPYMGTFVGLSDTYMNMTAIAPEKVQLDNLKWQTATEYNVGFDLTLWKGRFNFTFDWYHKEIKDLLQKKMKVPVSTGFSNIAWYNSGEMLNKGWELRLDYEIYKNSDWRVAANVNFSRNVNEITMLPDNLDENTYNFNNGEYAFRLESGSPVGSFFGYKYKGVYQNKDATYARDASGRIMTDMKGNPIVMKNGTYTCYPGDAIYEDLNHDGIINEYDMTYIGNGMPTFTIGGGISVKYKVWTLSATLHGRMGQKVINATRMNSESMHGNSNQSRAVLKRWRNEGDDTDIPRALYNYGYNYLGSDRFVENASYLRLKNLSLNYTIPKAVCQRWGISKLNVFVTGYDLFTWTKYTGQDPEVSLPGSAKGLVKDSANTPRARRFAAGININF